MQHIAVKVMYILTLQLMFAVYFSLIAIAYYTLSIHPYYTQGMREIGTLTVIIPSNYNTVTTLSDMENVFDS